jgi:O-antigen/teichoic acid export membrane protein
MGTIAPALEIEQVASNFQEASRTQIRGSSLLLVGRFISLGVNFLSQLLMVRYLATAEFGAIAYGLSIVAFCQPFAGFGLQDAASRFIPIFHEEEKYDELFGTILFISGATLFTGLAIAAAVWSWPPSIAHLLSQEALPKALLPILIFLVPAQSVDNLLIAVFASFASTTAIFFRRFILDPGLKLAVVLLLLVEQQQALFVAYGFVIAEIVGIVLYVGLLAKLFRRHGLFERFRFKSIRLPAREILAFSPPGLTAGLVTVAIYGVNASILGSLKDMAQVALYRAVVPLAQLNNVVMTSFALLYIPLSSRMFAKGDYRGMSDFYWRTTVWMAVLSFPIFALTFSTAQPITVFLYGERYRASAPILALLALGCYFNVLLGFNLQTLKVLEKLRYIVVVSILSLLINVAADFFLIPRYGALGAAIGTAGTLILYNLLLQAGLLLAKGLRGFELKYLSVYFSIALGALGIFAIQKMSAERITVAVPLVVMGSLLVVAISKRYLKAAETFPELLKVPWVKGLIG